jgi:hypothetical protein
MRERAQQTLGQARTTAIKAKEQAQVVAQQARAFAAQPVPVVTNGKAR